MTRSNDRGLRLAAMWLTISAMIAMSSGCKPRRPASASLRGTGEEAGAYTVDQAAAAEVEKVRAACDGKNTLFRGHCTPAVARWNSTGYLGGEN